MLALYDDIITDDAAGIMFDKQLEKLASLNQQIISNNILNLEMVQDFQEEDNFCRHIRSSSLKNLGAEPLRS